LAPEDQANRKVNRNTGFVPSAAGQILPRTVGFCQQQSDPDSIFPSISFCTRFFSCRWAVAGKYDLIASAKDRSSLAVAERRISPFLWMGERGTASLSARLGTLKSRDVASAGIGPYRSLPAPRTGESIEMAQRNWKRVLAGGAVVAALAFITPPPAQAAVLNTESLWSWLFNLWAGPASIPVSGHAHARKPSPRTGSWNKIGPCVDPNGNTGTQASGASVCGASSSDIGPGMDPNG